MITSKQNFFISGAHWVYEGVLICGAVQIYLQVDKETYFIRINGVQRGKYIDKVLSQEV